MTESPIRGPGPHQADEDDGQYRPAYGAEVVHGPLEAVGPAVDRRVDDVGQEGIAGRDANPRAAHAPARSIPTCQTELAAPVTDDSTAVAV